MRIIGGTCRGRKLQRPPKGVRPTTDRLRESLFNVLGDIRGTVWVDAFAGTGAVGLEALSRGAERVIFNERERPAMRTLEQNVERCGIESGCEIHRRDAFVLFRELSGRPVDFVFLDPPYAFQRHQRLLKKIHQTLAEGAPRHMVLLEIFKKTSAQVIQPYYRLARRLKAGDSHLLMLQPL